MIQCSNVAMTRTWGAIPMTVKMSYDEALAILTPKYGEHDAKEILSLLNFKEMLKKQLDNSLKLCYNKYIKRKKEVITMRATGIVRRIDDLGRVVIPKEIRRTLKIREGDPLEIFITKEGGVVFQKYNNGVYEDLMGVAEKLRDDKCFELAAACEEVAKQFKEKEEEGF